MPNGRASDRAYEVLREEILQWRLAPGTVLGEVEQSARLGVSRTPLREALSRLSADGRELFELREALETAAAALAAARRDPAVFASLAEEFDRAADLVGRHDLAAYYDLVGRFDEAIDASL